MLRLTRLIFVIVLIVIATVPTAGADRAQAVLPGDFMGMVVRDPHYEWNTNPAYPNDVNRTFYDTMGVKLQAAGVKWVRIEMRAEENIPYNPADPLQGLNLKQYDYFINVVAPTHGLKVIVLLATQLVKNPAYIDPEQIEVSNDEVPNCQLFRYGCGTNTYMRIWLDHAFAIADRYQNRVAAYEVMNEENRYLNGGGRGISPGVMARLMTKFYRVFKVTGPRNPSPSGPIYQGFPAWRSDVKVILGGIHPDTCIDCNPPGQPPMTDRQYLYGIYGSTAFQEFKVSYGRFPLDGVAYHPYPMEIHGDLLPEEAALKNLYRVPDRLVQIHQIMTIFGDTTNKIWVTEIGTTASPFDAYSQSVQAEFLHSLYWLLWQQRDFIATVLWFKYEDFAVVEGTQNWGVVRILPGTPPVDCPTCDVYDVSGTVQVYKQSYLTYQQIALQGKGMDTFRLMLPIVRR